MTRANPKLVGGFILGGGLLLLVAVAALASGKYFTKNVRMVSVFPESVRGLQIGSPVTFRGVPLGSVTGIEALLVHEGGGIDIAVTYDIDPSRIHDASGAIKKLASEGGTKAVEELAAKGLRAQLLSTSLVTGQLYIDLDFYPDLAPRMLKRDFPYPQVPTAPTKLQLLSQRMEKLAANISDIPFDHVVRDLSETLQAFRDVARSTELRGAFASAGTAAKDFSRSMANVDKLVADLRTKVGDADVAQMMRDLHDTLDSAQKSMAQLQQTVAGTSGVQREFSHTLAEIARAAAAVRVLADYLERNPSSIIEGKPAPAK